MPQYNSTTVFHKDNATLPQYYSRILPQTHSTIGRICHITTVLKHGNTTVLQILTQLKSTIEGH